VPHKLIEVNKNQRLTTCISLAAKQKKEEFFASNRDRRRIVGLLRESCIKKAMARPRNAGTIDSKTEHPWKKGVALYLVGPEGHSLLRTALAR